MDFKEIGSKIVLGLNKAKFSLSKNSPEILVVTGSIGVVVGAVLACKATLKVNDVLAETRDDLEKIHQVADDPKLKDRYPEETKRRDLTVVYTKGFLKLVKLYGPALAVEIASLVAILGGHDILRKRNAALGAAYAAVDKGFKEYRERVKKQFGEETDHRLKYNIKAKEIEEETTDENGEKKVEKKTVEVIDIKDPSEYAVFFDEYCPNWDKSPEYNKQFLLGMQEAANHELRSRGHLFLNEVYDLIGVPRTKAGQVIGWIWDPDDPSLQNYVSFGIFSYYRQGSADFVNGRERSILLDFNPDGNILYRI